MAAPYEVFASGLFDVYLAPAGTADPVINAAVPGAYVLVGVSGKLNYDESGIKISKDTSNKEVKVLGSYATRKVFRESESLKVMFTLVDATAEALRDAFNQTAITTLAGPPAEKTIPFLEGTASPTYRALLLRNSAASPYMDAGVTQVWIPNAYQTGGIEWLIAHKTDPVALALEFTAVDADANRLGKVHFQTA